MEEYQYITQVGRIFLYIRMKRTSFSYPPWMHRHHKQTGHIVLKAYQRVLQLQCVSTTVAIQCIKESVIYQPSQLYSISKSPLAIQCIQLQPLNNCLKDVSFKAKARMILVVIALVRYFVSPFQRILLAVGNHIRALRYA